MKKMALKNTKIDRFNECLPFKIILLHIVWRCVLGIMYTTAITPLLHLGYVLCYYVYNISVTNNAIFIFSLRVPILL